MNDIKQINTNAINMIISGFHTLSREYIEKEYKDNIPPETLLKNNIAYLEKLIEDFKTDEYFKQYYPNVFMIEYCKYCIKNKR